MEVEEGDKNEYAIRKNLCDSVTRKYAINNITICVTSAKHEIIFQ